MVRIKSPKKSSSSRTGKQSNFSYYKKRIKIELAGATATLQAKAKDLLSMKKGSRTRTKTKKTKVSANSTTNAKFSAASAPSKRLYKKMRKHQWARGFYKTAPKSRPRRILWYLHPKQFKNYWFSKHGLKVASVIFVSLTLTGLIIGGGVYAYYSRGLDDPRTLGTLEEGTKFYDRTGEILLYEVYGDKVRTVVEIDNVAQDLKDATVAIEDKNFYNHFGISPTGILRAAFKNTVSGSSQGGSTLTQQFIKNKVLTNEKRFDRKIKEAILALELERLYSKEEILSFYLNTIPYGGTAYGIESAANTYFDKTAAELTLDESALLAALPQRPSTYSPYGSNTDLLVGRQQYVLEQMLDQGYITTEEFDAAKEIDTLAKVVRNTNAYADIQAPHFVLEVQRQLEETYGPQFVTSGLKVITTIDMDLQKKAEQAITNGIANIDNRGGNNAALVASDPYTGEILAMVGSRDFFYPDFGTFNVALALRQPGSSVKPYTYATLLKENYGAGSVFYDVPTDFGGNYKPGNFDNSFTNETTMRKALASSRNIPAVKALYMAGIPNVIETWRDLGLASSDLREERVGLALTLGGAEVKLAEHVNGYESFVNGGKHFTQKYVIKVINSNGDELQEAVKDPGEQVLDPQISSIITDILKEVPKVKPGGTELAGKTGTTNSNRDGWQVGYSTRIAAGVWTGHSDNNQMRGFSTQTAGPIWNDFMTLVHQDAPAPAFVRADGIKTATLDALTGRAPDDATSSTVTDIFPSWFKAATSENTELKIDSVSGKLATECTPPAAQQTVIYGGVSAEIPKTDPAFERWNRPVQERIAPKFAGPGTGGVAPTENDDVHKCSDKKPVVQLDVNDLGGGEYEFEAEVTKGTFDLSKIDFKINDVIVSGGSQSISSSGTYKKKVFPSNNGSTKFSVVVTDSGLYDATSNKTVTVSGATSGIQALSPSGNTGSTNVTFTWNKDNKADGYKINIVDGPKNIPTIIIANKNTTSYNRDFNVTELGSYRWYIESLDDGSVLRTSNSLNFTVI